MHTRVHRFDFTDGPRGRLRIEEAHCERLRFHHVRSTGHRVSLTDNPYTVLLPLHGGIEVASGKTDLMTPRGGLLLSPPNTRNTRVHGTVDDDFRALVVHFPEGLVDEHLVAKAVSAPKDFISIPQENLQKFPASFALFRLLRFVDSELSLEAPDTSAFAKLRRLEALALEQFHHALGEFEGRSVAIERPCATSYAERALDIMHQKFAEPLLIPDIAADLGVSSRALQYAFRNAFGRSPREALNTVRLEAARDELLKAPEGQTIQEIAVRCGFVHMGRFASVYRQHFGESPSATRQRTR